MKIIMGNDHTAVSMKQQIADDLVSKGHEVVNVGTDTDDSVDYTDYAKLVAKAVQSKEADLGILICGTGIGMAIAANKVEGIRAAVCSDATSARLTREHNDANILTMGARIIGIELAKEIVDAFVHGEFAGGRHQRRVDKICDMEKEMKNA